MRITKRDGSSQQFLPNKILTRIKNRSQGLKVDAHELFQKVIPSIKDGMTTTDIDELIAFTSADMVTTHPDYSLLGGRLLLSRLSKLIDKPLQPVDETYDFFGAITFLKKYSKKVDGSPSELPSCMYERVAKHLAKDKKEYKLFADELKTKRINCATPIYTNAGIEGRNGMISCNLTHLQEDSIDGIENTLTKIAYASKEGAGIGLMIDNLRSKKSDVTSFSAKAGGIVRFADMVQSKMRFYKQGTRSGSCALYLSVWHRDIMDFLELTLPVGQEELRTRDLFLSVTINDLFMNKLLSNEPWHLFCPKVLKDNGLRPLEDLWGEEFEAEYQKAVDLGIGHEISPKKIWDSIIKSQVESGRPYVFFKDNANRKNMQSNIGVIKQSNLCIEIMEASKPSYTPQCTLGSINLSEHESEKTIKHSVKVLTRMLNRVIDKNKWSDDWSKNAGEDQRALAIGVAGMADFFAKKKISFESEEAVDWQHKIFGTMYESAVEESQKMAEEEGVYPAWEGSPYSKGIMYTSKVTGRVVAPSQREPIKVRNSLFLGLMPTASSSILLGVFESFEPVTSNLFTRRVGQGEFTVINKYLVSELDDLNLWNQEMMDKIIANGGSIQNIVEIPEDVRYRYRDVWEISQKTLLDLASVRNQYVDQSQSMNVYHKDAKYSKISSALMYAWKIGLKTGVYYTRTKSKIENNAKLAGVSKDKPKDSQFECFGCSS
jgi:ribonucleoside-diphosphate reductase alpha subunit